MKRFLHALLVIVGNVPLLGAYLCILFAMWIYVLADKLWPDATRGNCWSFALAQAWKRGGHVPIRPVREAKMAFGLGMALHAAWTPRLHGQVEQTEPVERYKGPSLLWRWMYFPFSARGADSKTSPAWSESEDGPLL